ncbi:MAG: hypothetical protein Q8N35_04005 [Methylococcaceae bacterium]|jgi:hypothetical protein|uniref:hypothetical protein n=1 Tax=Methylicorpusculum sp. TaxID=2713644 RepID=UPI0027177432|nr:hypothetical protein [Methylicorpusculum sp.]MDO9162995.1 hypothetical protein [Methylococcaceae bacterium]MDZ4156051.1 hypothetical protein [Methylococcales bacterium]MDP2395130.1 hypothetical protein [Methylococcaceae bacterium]MDP3018728.1 hypothetical protein [Methylococcaceae bacterium]MDP3388922.1 hypothetical protein [Methylococcaceae bacterium]
MNKNIMAALLVSSVLFTVNAQAVPIVGLYNTGEGITVDKTTDTNYQLTNLSGSSIYGGYGEAAVGSGWPISPWVADSDTSHWLTPTANRSQSFDPVRNGFYLWTLAFDLTGFEPSTASFTGRFSADNNAVAYLNGNPIGIANDFASWYSFTATSNYFVAGLNTLEFIVVNIKQLSGNPTGLRVEFTSSDVTPIQANALSSQVPAPGALALIAVGLLMFAGVEKPRLLASK